nr:putative porin [Geoanaerobacter pelophilus]
MTKEEANELQRRLSAEKAPAPEAKPEAKKQELPPPAEPLPEEDLKALVEVMREQGVVSVEEAQALGRRFAKAPADEPVDDSATPKAVAAHVASPVQPAALLPVIIADSEIPYIKSSMPPDEVEGLIKTAREQRVVTPDEADILMERFAAKAVLDQVATNVGNDIRQEIKEQMKLAAKEEIKAESKNLVAPDWTRKIKLSGDIRLRYQSEFFDKDNFDYLANDQIYGGDPARYANNRQRFRLRARLGATAKILDELEATVRLATGTTSDPVSTNVTMGDGFNKKNFLIDQAYLKWNTGVSTDTFTLWGGRFPNPWFSTDLVWDNDLNFEGFAVNYAKQFRNVGLFGTAGIFPLQEVELKARDKWLYGVQAGMSYKNEDETFKGRLGIALYEFINTQGKLNSLNGVTDSADNDYTLPASRQKGNTLFDINQSVDASHKYKWAYAAEFQELNITTSLDFGFWHPVHLVLMGDYVNNLGYKSADVDALAGTRIKKETEGYQYGIAVGYPAFQEFGDWKLYLMYRYLEADAVMDAFTDSDFHLGGTNTKGWTMGGEVGLAKNVWLTGKWMTANEISGQRYPDFPEKKEKLSIDVFQLDLNARF